jgi:hypothetical protein
MADYVEADLQHMLTNPKLILPKDVWVQNEQGKEIKRVDAVLKEDKMMDSGPETVADLAARAKEVKLVLWNGPLGEYEAGFASGTEDLLKALAESGATTIVGGGDTVALVDEMKIADKLTFVSTGGGAMLDFLADGQLPGIDALKTFQKEITVSQKFSLKNLESVQLPNKLVLKFIAPVSENEKRLAAFTLLVFSGDQQIDQCKVNEGDIGVRLPIGSDGYGVEVEKIQKHPELKVSLILFYTP